MAKLEQSNADSRVQAAVNDLEAWTSIYKMCVELRNFEIAQLVQRNNFFMIFQGVLLAGVCQSSGQIPVVSFLICVAGIGVSFMQAAMAAGAKYWQVHWELNTKKAEKQMIRTIVQHKLLRAKLEADELSINSGLMAKLQNRKLFAHLFQDEGGRTDVFEGLVESRRYAWFMNRFINFGFSSSRIPIYVGLLLFLVWSVLLANTVDVPFGFKTPGWLTGFSRSG